MEQAQISLVIPNMIAAALALDTLVRNVTGYADQVFDYETDNIQENKQSISKPYDSNNFTLFDLINRTLVTERIIPSPRCKLCGSNRD